LIRSFRGTRPMENMCDPSWF